MSCSYAENLSPSENKGKLGLPEIFDSADIVEQKALQLAAWLKASQCTVVHTGAGISTSAWIPDFRGPSGVWTLEKQGTKPSVSISWDDAKPTNTHIALVSLQRAGYISYIVTQNIDGLNLRSGIPRKHILELHGNLYVDKCSKCQRQFVRQRTAETVGLKTQGVHCSGVRTVGRRCRGKLHDTILDWEDSLPDAALELAHMHSCIADLSLCLGTTLQIVTSGNLPVHTKKRGGKLVICNLQPTKQDRYADPIIHSYVDDILQRVLKALDVPLLEYSDSLDPVIMTRQLLESSGYKGLGIQQINSPSEVYEWPKSFEPIVWTIPEAWVKDKDLSMKVKNKKPLKPKSRFQSVDPECNIKNKKFTELESNRRCEDFPSNLLKAENKESGNKYTKCENEKTYIKYETKEISIINKVKIKEDGVDTKPELNAEGKFQLLNGIVDERDDKIDSIQAICTEFSEVENSQGATAVQSALDGNKVNHTVGMLMSETSESSQLPRFSPV